MRTDVIVVTEGRHRVPQIPTFSPGRKHYVERGDMVEWYISNIHHVGRVIGFTTDKDDENKLYIVVAHIIQDLVAERWVEPKDVHDCYSVSHYQKMQWLFSDNFLKTDVDKARQCWELTVEQMK
jgi:hypothetical protein